MNPNVSSVDQGTVYARNAINARRATGVNFSEMLSAKTKELRFSSHAQARMKSRNIKMTPEIMDKLNKAVSGAEKKGSKDSLVLLSDSAFIVNIPNRTVVTAMDGDKLTDGIYTNIDSAVIAK